VSNLETGVPYFFGGLAALPSRILLRGRAAALALPGWAATQTR
jgi:hypothetical protein